jgi:hypothetical protein
MRYFVIVIATGMKKHLYFALYLCNREKIEVCFLPFFSSIFSLFFLLATTDLVEIEGK